MVVPLWGPTNLKPRVVLDVLVIPVTLEAHGCLQVGFPQRGTFPGQNLTAGTQTQKAQCQVPANPYTQTYSAKALVKKTQVV